MIWPMQSHCSNPSHAVSAIFMAGKRMFVLIQYLNRQQKQRPEVPLKEWMVLVDFTDRMSPLGNATAEECADFSIVLFSDLSRKVTMQNIYHDGGFSSMAMSLKAMTQYNKSLDE